MLAGADGEPLAPGDLKPVALDPVPEPDGDRIRHIDFGEGRVVAVTGGGTKSIAEEQFDTVTSVLQHMVADLPTALIKTITWDQGTEMAGHAAFTITTGCPLYFCDPHSPWQRGSNENTNGLIRDFYPKGTNFNRVTDADLADMQRLLNIRPRQTLGWRKPSDMPNELITSVALTP